nr:PREDICTED: stabilin-1 [Lepisosteus oculatus]
MLTGYIMHFFLILGLMVSSNAQNNETTPNRCDVVSTVQFMTPCTSCAASPTVLCPRGSRKTTKNIGIRDCSYSIEQAGKSITLPGCRHSCEKTITEHRCCPDYWGPDCLPCPSWSGRTCNWHGTCMDGATGNGACKCEDGFSGIACQECKNKNTYGEYCNSECDCGGMMCDTGPSGTGMCFCQASISGPNCKQENPACLQLNCNTYSFCVVHGSTVACECIPGFEKVGKICTDRNICSKNVCDRNAECIYHGPQKYDCICKTGYEGDGKVCIPVNPCATDNGGCPTNSTNCVFIGPGKSRCACKSGMERSTPTAGCTLRSACIEKSCHKSATCETGQDGTASCVCQKHQMADGWRCYGDIMERILELDREGGQKGRITGSIQLFEKGCPLTLSTLGPFTVFVPTLKSPLSGVLETSLCKLHIIIGQHLYRDLQDKTFWTLGGEEIRFKANKKFIFRRDPDTQYSIIQSDVAAANGIIHITDKPITNIHPKYSENYEDANKTIGEILAKDPKYNRFQSLVDNCGTSLPLKSPGSFTVFVPTNDAVDQFRDGSLIYMLTNAKHKLQELLKHHIYSSAAVTVDQLSSMSQIQTMAHQVILVNVTSDGRLLLGDKGVMLDTQDIVASNGIIHLINGVFVPPSIVPILPHRCDVKEHKITVGPCVSCSYISSTQCPNGSIELDYVDCNYQSSPLNTVLNRKGCAKYCNTTRMRQECCKGFYGPECKPCLGGFQNPCYDHGTCNDGIEGNGTCNCAPGFKGIACHICSDPNKHGEMCDEDCQCLHGVCDNRPGSQGVCRAGSCKEGYTGDFCEKTSKPCGPVGLLEYCHIHAYCSYTGDSTKCVCMSGYEGDGHSCLPINPCKKPNRGGCSANANCVYVGPGNASCVCNEGWSGDGHVCAEINNCLLESRGGCHSNADCTYLGPGQSECVCKKGYMGDGTTCDLINPCLSDNGGCHSLAKCKPLEDGGRECVCPQDYGGNGEICYGNILIELEGNSDFSSFHQWIKKLSDFDPGSNVTALVPSEDAIRSLNEEDVQFWTDPYWLQYLIKVHFLEGVFTSDDLKLPANKNLLTLNPHTKWEIKNRSGEVMIQNASIFIADIPAVNGMIHIIDKVLRPPLTDIPPPPPPLMEVLNKTPAFSLFRDALWHYNLISEILSSKKFTILVPFDKAIENHLNKTNSNALDEDVLRYHIIVKERLFPEDLKNGILKSTLMGQSYQIMFHNNKQNQTFANEVPMNVHFNETRNGVLIGINQILEIHKNRCDKNVTLKAKGRCGACDGYPRCSEGSTPLKPLSATDCKYRKPRRGKKKTTWRTGCAYECLKTTLDHSCCPGYFGHYCYKCPGKPGSWCSNNGKCHDGIFGNGECLCNEGFHGTACENCEPGRYAKDCKSVCTCSHGKCMDGIKGDGRCLCYKGWKGANCTVEIVADACNGTCDPNANCITERLGATPTCSCSAGYQGNGTFCTEINLCDTDNGGCSQYANCSETIPGERSCTCQEGYTGDGVVCLEIDGCLEDNGGCHPKADCIKTGPNLVGCNCKSGYSGNGKYCFPVNPCRVLNGGCSIHAWCEYTGPGTRNCTCRRDYIGDGFNCKGNVNQEILRHPAAAWFYRHLRKNSLNDLSGKGPFTVFLPHQDYVQNVTLEDWTNTNRTPHLLRYHLVGCQSLQLSDLQSVKKLISLSGHSLHISVKEDTVYINEETKIVISDYVTSNGVLHFIDKVLIPYDLKNKSGALQTSMNLTATAEAHGYSIFSKLLQDAELLCMVQNALHQPFTMLWPTDEVFNGLPEERKKWLYSEDHRDKLAAYIKVHMIRDAKLLAVNLPHQQSLRTMYGSSISFSCDKNLYGDVLVDDGNAKIIERHIMFDVGIAHGIDQLLEPPNMGARCDNFTETKSYGRCGSCLYPPSCYYGTVPTGEIDRCRYEDFLFSQPWRRRYSLFDDDIIPYRYGRHFGRFRTHSEGCRKECVYVTWVPKCCKNHYGRDCQVCPGGLESPCSNHGVCTDGKYGTGYCTCEAGFTGTACELCAPKRYGPNCTECTCAENGKCDEGLEGDGSCFCQEGWNGDRCEIKLGMKPICEPKCDPNAVCQPGNICVCDTLYEGDGRNCTAPDFCSDNSGVCHEHADCTQIDVNVTCLCKLGYTGDGYSCSAINRCVEEDNGGCDDFATCIFTGPNERRCECNVGYVGNGIQCLEKAVPPVDRCEEENGGCHPEATCTDVHFHERTAGVFHLRSTAGKYKLNYTEAKAACQAEGATLATFSQMSAAQQLGFHLCTAGWIDGTRVGYPITFPSVKCGNNHVGIVEYKDPVESNKYDAFCFRLKEVKCVCRNGYIGDGDFCNGNFLNVVATQANFSLFYSKLLEYANSSVKGEEFINFLSNASIFETLFVPANTGFGGNETLSWRDLEYHVSVNNSFTFYADLSHGKVIPSRLGYNLSVAGTSLIGRSLTNGSKLINEQLIIEWDIPATNGIIHVIEKPLRAPPVPPLANTEDPQTQSKSPGPAVAAVLGVVLFTVIVGGLLYYYFKHKNEGFQFHYFKSDEDDDDSLSTGREDNPALVSIPNPLYSGYNSFAEPFGEEPEGDVADTHHILD